MNLDKAGLDRYVKLKARNLISGVMDAMEDELSERSDLKFKTSIKSTATIVSGEMRVSSDRANILSEELGTENSPPKETVGRLVKDPSTRMKLIRKAMRSQ